MKQQKLTVRARKGIGRGHSRRIRAGGEVPAVIYGKHNAPQALAVNQRLLAKLLKDIGSSAAVLEIEEEGGKPRLSVISEVQRDPITDQILHLDLHEVDASETMDVSVTVHTTGTAFGVKNEGGVIELVAHDVLIRCLPANLPEFVVVDVTDMHVDDTIHISDLKPIDGVEFLDDPTQPVVSCGKAVAEEVAVPVAAVAVEGAEPAAAGAEPAGAAPAKA
ncbi:MAG: 50S ribosomal protein L25 [Opitutaceae bacterium]